MFGKVINRARNIADFGQKKIFTSLHFKGKQQRIVCFLSPKLAERRSRICQIRSTETEAEWKRKSPQK